MKTALTPKRTSYLRTSFLIGFVVAITASVAHAQYYVRGEFNNWDTSALMTDEGGGLYTYQMTGLAPNSQHNFKIANADWSIGWPGSNSRVMADANGAVTFRAFDSETWSDGWLPENVRRVGYTYAGAAPHGWELTGSMTAWDVSPLTLTDEGNGVYRGEVFLATGDYEYKYRMTGSWDINIGSDFGNSAGNIALNVPVDGTYAFELDVTNGRYTTSAIPEPSTYAALFGLGALAAVILRRRMQRS